MITATTVRGGGRGYHFGGHVSPMFRPAFPSSAIISERSSPSRVRCAAPNNGAPLTAPGRSDNTFWARGKGSCRTAYRAGGDFAAKMVPFFAAADTLIVGAHGCTAGEVANSDPPAIAVHNNRRVIFDRFL